MPKNDTKDMIDALAKAIQRREALLGLGAFASSALLIGCGSDTNSGGGNGGSPGSGGSGSGGAPGSGGAQNQSGGAPGSGGAQNQSGGASSGGTGSGGTGSGGMQAKGGSANGGSANGGNSTTGSGGGSSNITGGTSPGGSSSSGGMANSAGAGGGGGDVLMPPKFDDAPMCTASACDIAAGQGPFMIHDLEKDDDISLFRQDIRGRYNMDAAPGVEMQLHLRLLDATSGKNCVPLSDVDVYIWHTDGQGFYSGFGKRGTSSEQNPDKPYSGTPSRTDLLNTDRFCRGVQTTGSDGIVSFRSIFPGWYNGRDVHIHFVALKKGSAAIKDRNTEYSKSTSPNWLFTTQLYFDPDFTASVHTKYDPYKARTTGSLATYYQGAIKADEPGNSKIHAKASMNGDIVIAQYNMLLDSAIKDNKCNR